MNRIDQFFEDARRNRQTAFVPFVTAGDPDLATTRQVIEAIDRRAVEAGVPMLVEVGFPYSDPIADGPVIQASYTRALERGVRLADIFTTLAALREQCSGPMVAMASYSLVLRRGLGRFIEESRSAGLDGAVIPDLPIEEADAAIDVAAAADFKLIQLIAPTTPPERAERILARASGFVYCVARTGITGERDRLPDDLSRRLSWLRQRTELPICVGFGISRPEQMRELRGVADGIIVGSAIVRLLDQIQPNQPEGIEKLTRFVSQLFAPLSDH